MDDEPNYDEINPGVRELVRRLRAAGFKTVDSGDGVTHDFDCDRDHAYVAMLVEPARLPYECDRLRDLLSAWGVVVGPQRLAALEATMRELGWKPSRAKKSAGPKGATQGGSIRDRVLAAVREEPGSTVGELAEELGLRTEQVSPALAALRDASLISSTGTRGSFSWFPEDVEEE